MVPTVLSRLKQYLPGALLIAIALTALYKYFPYYEGYTSEKASLWDVLWSAWHGYQDEWEHGMLVPFIVILLVYLDRKRLQALEIRPSRWGLALIIFSFFCFWVGYCAAVEYFGWASMQIMSAGLILWFLGKEMMKALLFPWAFLVFMFPMPFLDNMLAFPLRLFMSHSSHILLNLIGVANDQVGTSIVSSANPAMGLAQGARFAIDVADPCSGIRSLFALIMVGALFAHLTLERPWQKWILFFAAIPLAVVGNIVRLMVLTFATIWWGTDIAIGAADHPTWIHEGAGFAVFIVALGGMMGCGHLLGKWGQHSSPADVLPPASPSQNPRPISFPLTGSAIVAGMSVATALLCYWTTPPTGMTVAGVTMTLPDYVDHWWGYQEPMSEAEKTILPTDTEFERKHYDSHDGDRITCTIVLSGAERRSIHRPEICLPGQGYTIESSQVIDVPLHSGNNLKVMNLTLTRPARTADGRNIQVSYYFMYWFVGDKVTTPYHMSRLWLTSWDRIVHHVNHRWAYVSLVSPITEGLAPQGRNPEETMKMLKDFIADVVPSFQKDGV